MPVRHPNDELLLEYCSRGSAASSGSETEAHLRQGCGRCLRRIEQYREVLRSLEADPLEKAPEEFLQLAMDRIRLLEAERSRSRSRQGIGASVRRAVEAIRLALVVDSLDSPALQGIRAAADPDTRRLLFEAPQASLHLQIRQARGGAYRVTGLFAPASGVVDPGARVTLERAGGQGEEIARKRISEGGDFLFPSIAPGPMQIRIESPGGLFRTDPLQIEGDDDA
ncbi:MAG: hypothetical protein GF346_07800 [Candidatus Eisenbacteria bacterium]|nr:hypothetical protein [Candidatus Latescibacterota bacterium]MBD3302336.1 hypothetical protein [Candidatus Eisenbacteria bacterium]